MNREHPTPELHEKYRTSGAPAGPEYSAAVSHQMETCERRSPDPSFLADGVRVITRWLSDGMELSPLPCYQFADHRRVVRKRLTAMLSAKKESARRNACRDLLLYAGKVREYALAAIPVLRRHQGQTKEDAEAGRILAEKLVRAVGILDKAMHRAESGASNSDSPMVPGEPLRSGKSPYSDTVPGKR